jgi:hypothetical protein
VSPVVGLVIACAVTLGLTVAAIVKLDDWLHRDRRR